MGFFDLFRRRRRNSSEIDVNYPELQAFMAANRPRCQHYHYAHGALREVALERPMLAFGGVCSPDLSADFGRRLWDAVTEQCRQMGQAADEPFPGIEARPMKAGRYPCAVVKMPEPKQTTEAYFVAIVLHFDPAAGKPSEPVEASYITLEKGFETEGRPRTTLGEWTKTSHLNYGDGPPPDWEPFLEAVTKLVEGRGRPPVARTGI